VSELLILLGIQNLKPVMTALVMPPAPLLVGILLGARLLARRRVLGWAVIALCVCALWLCTCMGMGRLIERHALHLPPALDAERTQALQAAPARTAIVVLGGGKERMAPEYRMPNLSEASLERLRYGVWLGRATGVPVAFSGGVGWGQSDSESEAEVAARIAKEEFSFPLTWAETASRDTRENAALTVPLLQAAGIDHVILVTHGWHMPRAQRAFEEAAQGRLRIEAAPMGLGSTIEAVHLEWIPTSEGMLRVRRAIREILGHRLGF
jgi:uncharacterized SAM-binding protein YcdF (DUF218 family)